MKLILTADVPNLGAPGDIVEVKDGYGRNYLLPRGLAIVATRGAEKQVATIRRAQQAREIRDLGHAKRGRRASSGKLDRHRQGEGRGRLGPAVRLGHRVRRRRRRPGRRRPGARPARGRGARPDQDRRQAPGHGAPAPGGHHRAGRRGRRRLTPASLVREGRVRGRTDPAPAPLRLRTTRAVTSRGRRARSGARYAPRLRRRRRAGLWTRRVDTRPASATRRTVDLSGVSHPQCCPQPDHPALSCEDVHKPGGCPHVCPQAASGQPAGRRPHHPHAVHRSSRTACLDPESRRLTSPRTGLRVSRAPPPSRTATTGGLPRAHRTHVRYTVDRG